MDVGRYNHLDEFQISGHWWLPNESQDKVPGTLFVKSDFGGRLELAGSFYRFRVDFFSLLSPRRPIFLELVLGGVVPRILVRVEFHRQLAIGGFENLGGGALLALQRLVIAALRRRHFKLAPLRP